MRTLHALIAARHGEYNKENTASDTACAFVSIDEISHMPRTESVETIDSFAKRPENSAAHTLKSPSPRGLMRGDINFAAYARRLSFGSLVT